MQAINLPFNRFYHILIYVYIWQIPFSWRYIFIPSSAQSTGGFNEYMDISLYFGEILLLLALLIKIQSNEFDIKSICSNVARWKFHVEHFILYIGVLYLLIGIYLSIDAILSIAAIFHLMFLFSFGLMFIDLVVSRGTIVIKEVAVILSLSLFIQLIISCLQVINFESIGLNYLNESNLGTAAQNIAKSNIFSFTLLRGYGTFPHPNVLSAYALLVFVYLLEFGSLFHVKQRILIVVSVISFLTILVAQSKLAIFAYFGLLVTYFYARSNWNILFHVKHRVLIVVLFLLVLVFQTLLIRDSVQSYRTRLTQFSEQLSSTKITKLGSGIGSYRLSYYTNTDYLNWWNYEPIHFVPYIVLVELGIVGLIVFSIFIYRFFRSVPRETLRQHYLLSIFLVYIIVTDHYPWDIYQGQFILALGITLVTIRIDKMTL